MSGEINLSETKKPRREPEQGKNLEFWVPRLSFRLLVSELKQAGKYATVLKRLPLKRFE